MFGKEYGARTLQKKFELTNPGIRNGEPKYTARVFSINYGVRDINLELKVGMKNGTAVKGK